MRQQPDFRAFTAALRACDYHGAAMLDTARCNHSVAAARNYGVAQMLRQNKFDHLLFVDNDTIIPINAIATLVRTGKDIISGCVGTLRPEYANGKPYISIAEREENGLYFWRREWFRGVRETVACGGACLLVSRAVFEKVGFPWFTWTEHMVNGEHASRGEDVTFCERVRAEGFKIYAHGDVRCGHFKEVDVSHFIDEEMVVDEAQIKEFWNKNDGELNDASISNASISA